MIAADCRNEWKENRAKGVDDAEHLPDDLRYYKDLEKEAREKGLGIWAKEK